MSKKRLMAGLLALMLPGAALAQGHTLGGLRLYAPDAWRVITQENLSQHRDFLTSLGADPGWEGLVPAAGAVIYAPGMEVRLRGGPQVGVPSVWQADEGARAEILQVSQKAWPTLKGAWLNEEFVLLTGQEGSRQRRVYATCQYGQIWALEADSYHKPFTEEEIAQLDALARDLCVMGEAPEAEIGPVVIPAHEGQAEVRPSQDGVPLTLDPPYATVVAPFEVAGQTSPKVDLRYYVNGVGVERFKSDEQGRFTVTVRHLDRGENAVRIQAIDGGARGSVLFYVNYDPARTPVTLAKLPGQTFEEQVTVQGRALPGTQLTLLRDGRSHGKATVGEEGLFTLTARTDKAKTYAFTLQAQHPDYRQGEAEFEIVRIPTADKLEGVVALTGRITRLGSDPQGPYLWFEEDGGGAYCLSMPCLAGFEEAAGTAYLRPTGQTRLGVAEAEMILFTP